MVDIIIKSNLKSRGRSDHEKVLIDAGWGRTMTPEQADKCEHLERKAKKIGVDKPTAFREHQINRVK